MKAVSMLEFRRQAAKIINRLRRGERMVLTYRGKAVARLEPITRSAPEQDDPFYRLRQLADAKGRSLTNEQIDRIIYGT